RPLLAAVGQALPHHQQRIEDPRKQHRTRPLLQSAPRPVALAIRLVGSLGSCRGFGVLSAHLSAGPGRFSHCWIWRVYGYSQLAM
ncbi:hypothetical protein LPJ57_006953, partial [Coemansia sp. RSA 486]